MGVHGLFAWLSGPFQPGLSPAMEPLGSSTHSSSCQGPTPVAVQEEVGTVLLPPVSRGKTPRTARFWS